MENKKIIKIKKIKKIKKKKKRISRLKTRVDTLQKARKKSLNQIGTIGTLSSELKSLQIYLRKVEQKLEIEAINHLKEKKLKVNYKNKINKLKNIIKKLKEKKNEEEEGEEDMTIKQFLEEIEELGILMDQDDEKIFGENKILAENLTLSESVKNLLISSYSQKNDSQNKQGDDDSIEDSPSNFVSKFSVWSHSQLAPLPKFSDDEHVPNHLFFSSPVHNFFIYFFIFYFLFIFIFFILFFLFLLFFIDRDKMKKFIPFMVLNVTKEKKRIYLFLHLNTSSIFGIIKIVKKKKNK